MTIEEDSILVRRERDPPVGTGRSKHVAGEEHSSLQVNQQHARSNINIVGVGGARAALNTSTLLGTSADSLLSSGASSSYELHEQDVGLGNANGEGVHQTVDDENRAGIIRSLNDHTLNEEEDDAVAEQDFKNLNNIPAASLKIERFLSSKSNAFDPSSSSSSCSFSATEDEDRNLDGEFQLGLGGNDLLEDELHADRRIIENLSEEGGGVKDYMVEPTSTNDPVKVNNDINNYKDLFLGRNRNTDVADQAMSRLRSMSKTSTGSVAHFSRQVSEDSSTGPRASSLEAPTVEMCCICLDGPPDPRHILPCGHANMCGGCVTHLLSKVYGRCPYCRVAFRRRTPEELASGQVFFTQSSLRYSSHHAKRQRGGGGGQQNIGRRTISRGSWEVGKATQNLGVNDRSFSLDPGAFTSPPSRSAGPRAPLDAEQDPFTSSLPLQRGHIRGRDHNFEEYLGGDISRREHQDDGSSSPFRVSSVRRRLNIDDCAVRGTAASGAREDQSCQTCAPTSSSLQVQNTTPPAPPDLGLSIAASAQERVKSRSAESIAGGEQDDIEDLLASPLAVLARADEDAGISSLVRSRSSVSQPLDTTVVEERSPSGSTIASRSFPVQQMPRRTNNVNVVNISGSTGLSDEQHGENVVVDHFLGGDEAGATGGSSTAMLSPMPPPTASISTLLSPEHAGISDLRFSYFSPMSSRATSNTMLHDANQDDRSGREEEESIDAPSALVVVPPPQLHSSVSDVDDHDGPSSPSVLQRERSATGSSCNTDNSIGNPANLTTRVFRRRLPKGAQPLYTAIGPDELAKLDAQTSIAELGILRASDLDMYRELRRTFVRYREFQDNVSSRTIQSCGRTRVSNSNASRSDRTGVGQRGHAPEDHQRDAFLSAPEGRSAPRDTPASSSSSGGGPSSPVPLPPQPDEEPIQRQTTDTTLGFLVTRLFGRGADTSQTLSEAAAASSCSSSGARAVDPDPRGQLVHNREDLSVAEAHLISQMNVSGPEQHMKNPNKVEQQEVLEDLLAEQQSILDLFAENQRRGIIPAPSRSRRERQRSADGADGGAAGTARTSRSPKSTSPTASSSLQMSSSTNVACQDVRQIDETTSPRLKITGTMLLDRSHVLCPCGEKMDVVLARGAYENSNAACPVECDLCSHAIRGRVWLYHCPSQRSRVHPFGFDLCCRCATGHDEPPDSLKTRGMLNSLGQQLAAEGNAQIRREAEQLTVAEGTTTTTGGALSATESSSSSSSLRAGDHLRNHDVSTSSTTLLQGNPNPNPHNSNPVVEQLPPGAVTSNTSTTSHLRAVTSTSNTSFGPSLSLFSTPTTNSSTPSASLSTPSPSFRHLRSTSTPATTAAPRTHNTHELPIIPAAVHSLLRTVRSQISNMRFTSKE
ncbi:unnamed protein product [Amoebophrya sp. A25]|nr:unnamed protein product [Amoebophrya sp. A25]|eukprot:GSA25T00020671001.1